MLRKGTRVEYTEKGETKYGVVSKGGSRKVTVVLDGAKLQVAGHPQCFKESTQPLPKDKPSEMDRYSIRGYKEIQGHGDSRTFHATILENGKPVLNVMNDGWGGCNSYQPFNYEHPKRKEIEERFYSAVKSWVTQFGYADMLEPEDTWVEWWQHQRPYGMTAQWMVEDYRKSLEGIRKGG